MGPMESSNRKYTNIQNDNDRANECDGNKTANIRVEMPGKHSRQRRRRKRNCRTGTKEKTKQKKIVEEKEREEVGETGKRKSNLEYRKGAKTPTVTPYIGETLRHIQRENNNFSGIHK